MMQSDLIGELAKALASAQTELKNPVKKKTAKVGTYSYQYADIAEVLDTVRPILARNGIALTQPTVLAEDVLVVQTRLTHAASGQWMTSDYPVCRLNGDHQKMGAAMTYARRYALCSMIGVAADDDRDGEGAAEVSAPQKKSARGPDWGKANQARKRGDWPVFIAALKDCQSAHEIDRLQREYEENDAWAAGWKEKAAEECEKYRADFKEPGEALTLKEQLEGSLEAERSGEVTPQTRAEYIQWAHETIAALESSEFIASWWKAEAPSRKRFRLTPAEETDLHTRAKERVTAIRAATFVPNARERMLGHPDQEALVVTKRTDAG